MSRQCKCTDALNRALAPHGVRIVTHVETGAAPRPCLAIEATDRGAPLVARHTEIAATYCPMCGRRLVDADRAGHVRVGVRPRDRMLEAGIESVMTLCATGGAQ